MPGSPTLRGVVFRTDTLRRLGGRGDNWCQTWAADDSVITSLCDGNWLNTRHGNYHNRLYRIRGGPDKFRREELSGYPDFSGEAGSWFGYGIVSVDGVLYSAVSKTPGPAWSGPFTGVKLLRSTDLGKTWSRVDRQGSERSRAPNADLRNAAEAQEMFLLREDGMPHAQQEAYPFAYFDFVQCGKDYSQARDDYLYLYAPEGAHAHRLMLARVGKDRVGLRTGWEFFQRYENDQPIWTRVLGARGPVHLFPEADRAGRCFGWYSWLPSVVWNEALGLYIMVNGGTYAGHGMTASDQDYYDYWMHTRSGSLGFWYSEHPYGPWREFFYTENWIVDDPANLLYQPKLSPKWISSSGREMVLIWSDAMKNAAGQSHTTNYVWNQMVIKIE